MHSSIIQFNDNFISSQELFDGNAHGKKSLKNMLL